VIFAEADPTSHKHPHSATDQGFFTDARLDRAWHR